MLAPAEGIGWETSGHAVGKNGGDAHLREQMQDATHPELCEMSTGD